MMTITEMYIKANQIINKPKTMTKESIIALTCKKHVKIYKLKQLGLSNKEIAEALATNAGHVYNALKNYDTNPEMKTEADLIV